MTRKEVEAVRAALGAIEFAIVRAETAMRVATGADRCDVLSNRLIGLKAARTSLQVLMLTPPRTGAAADNDALDGLVAGFDDRSGRAVFVDQDQTLTDCDQLLQHVTDLSLLITGGNTTRDRSHTMWVSGNNTTTDEAFYEFPGIIADLEGNNPTKD
jgi:hypothetical protein